MTVLVLHDRLHLHFVGDVPVIVDSSLQISRTCIHPVGETTNEASPTPSRDERELELLAVLDAVLLEKHTLNEVAVPSLAHAATHFRQQIGVPNEHRLEVVREVVRRCEHVVLHALRERVGVAQVESLREVHHVEQTQVLLLLFLWVRGSKGCDEMVRFGGENRLEGDAVSLLRHQRNNVVALSQRKGETLQRSSR